MSQDVEARPLRPPPPASWLSLPNKGQLALIASVRVVDFFQQASLQAYQFYQLKSFAPNADDTVISFQSGVLQGVFTAAQIVTGIIWGRVADAPWAGRKTVLLIGLVGQGISCVGIAFSTSFTTAVVWRCLGGAVNGTVGGARTALAENTEKRFHSRSFLLLPLAWNVANIFGPILGGLLADPLGSYPQLLGKNSVLGGTDGVGWLTTFPYAAPNLFSAFILFADALLIWLGLRETLVTRKFVRDRGVLIGETIQARLSKLFFPRTDYTPLPQSHSATDSELSEDEPTPLPTIACTTSNGHHVARKPSIASQHGPHQESPATGVSLYSALTPNVLLVLSTIALFDFQMGGFASLWIVFLSSRRRTEVENDSISLPFKFYGGLGFTPSTVGFAMSILGMLGITLQFALYPSVNGRFGLLRSTRWSLFIFPVAYTLAPYLSLLTSAYQPNLPLWIGIVGVLLLQVGARTFALPGTILLINNASPSPSTLGTIHGMGAATSSAFRTVGPIVAGHWYAQGIEMGMVGYAWWLIAGVSILGCVPSFFAQDGG